MSRSFLRRCTILVMAVAFAVLLFFVTLPRTARADTDVNVDEISVNLTFGEKPPKEPVRSKNGVSFIVKNYLIKGEFGEDIPLLDGSGNVSYAPSDTPYQVSASVAIVECDSAGNEITPSSVGFLGKVFFSISGATLNVPLATEDLRKEYGADLTETPLSVEIGTGSDKLTVTFASEGFAPTADARAEGYALNAVSVIKGEDTDVTAYYTVIPQKAGTTEKAKIVVFPKALNAAFSEDPTIPFNEPNKSIPLALGGANGEAVTCSFVLTGEAIPQTLSIGDLYALALDDFVVSGGTSPKKSNYEVTAPGEPKARAVAGEVILTQSAETVAAHAGDSRYVYLDVTDFTFTYHSPFVLLYGGELVFEDVEIYPSVFVTLHCTIERAEGAAIPCGTYPLALTDENGIFLDAGFSLVVTPLVLTYSEESACQYKYPAFAKDVEKDGYTFRLEATTAEASVGALVPYAASEVASKEDPNVRLDCSAARVRIVKRTDGVSFKAAGDLTNVYYRDAFTVCVAVLTVGETVTTLEETIRYEYRPKGTSAYISGLPETPGEYEIRSTLASDLYAAATDGAYELTIVKCPVLVVFNVTTAEKAYGETFLFTEKLSLAAIYRYDAATGQADRTTDYHRASNDIPLGSNNVASTGASATAALGTYPITFSISTDYYDVRKLVLYQTKTKEETEVLTVVKGLRPPKATITVRQDDRTVFVTGEERSTLCVELAETETFASPQTITSQTGEARFTNQTYGQVYYARARVTDPAHYEEDGEWSDVASLGVRFPALSVQVSSVTDSQAVFTAREIEDAVPYVVEHKVGSGAWREGLTAEGLTPDTEHTLSFRAKAGGVTGETVTLTVKTLCAAIEESSISVSYDRAATTLTVSVGVAAEYRLLTREGEALTEWSAESVLADVPRDGEYILQVRNAAEGELGAITSIELDTYRPKEPLTAKVVLSDWFLLFIAAAVVIALVIITLLFARSKKKADRRAIGGKYGK